MHHLIIYYRILPLIQASIDYNGKRTISISISTDTHPPQKAQQTVMHWGFKSNLNLTVFSCHALCDVLYKYQLNGQSTDSTVLLNSPL